MIKVKSTIEIANIDPLEGRNGYAVAELRTFDLLDYSYQIVYGYNYTTPSGAEMYQQTQRLRKNLTPAEIDNLFTSAGIDIIAATDSFDTKIKQILGIALKAQLVHDQRFGLTLEQWELVS